MNPTAAPTTEDPQDKRLDGLDPALSQAERSIAICKLCNLKDEVWKCVYVVDKKQGKQPVWMCPCCGEQKNGGPDRIMAHYVKAAPGLALCEPKDFPGAMDKFVKNQEVCEKKWQSKKEQARVKKRDAAHLAALEAAKKPRQIQTTLEDASQPVAWTPKDEADQKWAQCCYEKHIPFEVFSSAVFREAVDATARVFLAQGDQRKYVPPSAKEVASDKVMVPIYNLASNEIIEKQKREVALYGACITGDGCSSNPQRRPMVGGMTETPGFVRYQNCIDASGATKNADWMADTVCDWIGQGAEELDTTKESYDLGIFDGAEAATIEELEDRMPWFTGGKCSPHSLDLGIEDYGKLEWVASILDEALDLAKFIKNHQKALFLWRKHADHEVLLPNQTRFATRFIMAGSLLQEKGACKEMFNSREFEEWIKKQKYKKEGERLQAFVNNREWWDRLEAVHDAIEPVIALLRDTDGGKPVMGKFYFRMFSCIEAVREDDNLSEAERAEVVKILESRWKYMHFSYHGAGYALDPEYHQVDHGSIPSVMDDLYRVLERHYWDKPEKVALAKAEFAQFKAANVGHLTHPSTWTMAKTMPSWEWWNVNCAHLPTLRLVAMKVLSKRTSASSVEHLWSKFKAVWTKARASLGAKKACRLVALSANLFIARRALEMGKDDVLIPWDDPEQIANPEDARGDDSSSEDEPAVSD